MDSTEYVCNFCTKDKTKVRKLISGPGVFICDECIEICYDLLTRESQAATTEEDAQALPTPRKVKEFLDQFVVGQDSAKIKIAVAVINHYKRLNQPEVDGVEIAKSNMLMVGPTGCGKTLLAQSIARMLDVPFAMADATSITEAGYYGEDVESIIARLLSAANGDVAKAERGIVFIDEIDKKSRKTSGSNTRDVGGEGVQQALLKMIEGSEMLVPPLGGKKGLGSEMVRINTTNILFIVSGAFVGLDKIVAEDTTQGQSIGFNAGKVGMKVDAKTLRKVTSEHMTAFGLIPELVGRLPVIAVLDELTSDQLVHVLTEPRSALTRQYEALFQMDDIALEFTPDMLKAVAHRAIERKTGARGLRNIMEDVLTDVQYRLPELAADGVKKIIVGADILDGADATLIYG